MNKSNLKFLLICCLCLDNIAIASNVRQYHFDIDYLTMNQTGKDVQALSIHRQIPGPVIQARVGDTLQVTFTNKLKEETSIHWHGILLPNDQDGVPYLTTPPIKPGHSLTYEFPITHSGTYWYHSHSGLQEQRGLYGALVFLPPNTTENFNSEQVVVFSDWTNEHPKQVMANLKKSDDFYAFKKDAVQSWDKVIHYGPKAIQNRLQASWTRMGPMDFSDVGYDAFLANGQKQYHVTPSSSDKIKLRLINAAASTYFKVNFAGGPMTVVAADGLDVVPYTVDDLTMAIAETYDIIIDLPDDKSYELRASSEDGTGYSSTFIGEGPKVFAQNYQPPNVFLISHADHSTHGNSHQAHQHHMQGQGSSHNGNEYDNLRSLQNTEIISDLPDKVVQLELTGFMDGFQWSFNNTPFSRSDKILIKKGQRVRFILINRTMMHHPIHLHGHFFRVLNKHDEYSPLKHTVNVPAMGQQIIEFDANEDQDWFFHCHNLYHMKAGMTRVISYDQDPKLSQFIKSKLAKDNELFLKAEQSFLSQMAAGEYLVFNNKHNFGLEYDWDWDSTYDAELFYAYRFSRFLYGFVGGEFEKDEHESEQVAIFGIRYMLPLLILSEWRIDSEGDLRLQLSSELPLTKRISFEWFVNTDKEYRLGLYYELFKSFKAAVVYDDEHKIGAGIKLEF